MDRNVGVWIDHDKALIVQLQGSKEVRMQLASEVERHTRQHGGGRPATPFGVSETRADRRRENQIKAWCREVMEAVADADRIYLLGPGEAKRDLLREMEKSRSMAGKIVGCDSADHMTENQVAAQVREYFRVQNREVPEYRRPPGT